MSKEKVKKIKPKLTGMDIMYKIVVAVMAVVVPIAAVFAEFIHFILESSVFAFLAQLQGNTSDDGSTEDGYSFYSFYKEVMPLFSGSEGDGSSIWAALEPVHMALIFTAVFLVLAVVAAVVMLFLGLFSRKKLPQLIVSAVGLVSVIGMFISFNKFATPIVDGTLSLGSFFESAIMSTILPFVASFSMLRLSTAATVMLVVYIAMVCWIGAYMIIEIGDKPKKQKKIK